MSFATTNLVPNYIISNDYYRPNSTLNVNSNYRFNNNSSSLNQTQNTITTNIHQIDLDNTVRRFKSIINNRKMRSLIYNP